MINVARALSVALVIFLSPLVAHTSQDPECTKCCGARGFVYSWHRSCTIDAGEGQCHVTECEMENMAGGSMGCCWGAFDTMNDRCTYILVGYPDTYHGCY